MELWDLRVTVESIEGRSVCGLSVGDYFELTHSSHLTVPPGHHFCIYALAAVLPGERRNIVAEHGEMATRLRTELKDWLATEALVCCPDPGERLVMRVERLRLSALGREELT